MKRLIIFLIFLSTFGGMYNFSILRDAVSGFFGDRQYHREDFSRAQTRYTKVLEQLPQSTRQEADTLYNLGNTLYRLGEQEKDEKRTTLWKESIEKYTKSLSIRIDQETEENLAFVKEELQREEKEQEQKKQDTEKEKQEEQSGSGAEKKSEPSEIKKDGDIDTPRTGKDSLKKESTEPGSESEKNTPKSWQNWSNGGSYNPIGWQNKDSDGTDLSDVDRQEVKKYTEELKQFEKQNGKFLNPEKSKGNGSISDQIRDFFGNDSFFQDVLPNSDGKKDW